MVDWIGRLGLGVTPCVIKTVNFGLFREPDSRNWKSPDTRVPVNNFVKTHNYSRMYKITNMNTSFSCFISHNKI